MNDLNKTSRSGMKKVLKIALMVILDIIVINLSTALSLILRFDQDVGVIPDYYVENFLEYMPVNTVITIAVFVLMQMYSSLWQYASTREICFVVLACVVSSTMHYMISTFFFAKPLPRSCYIFACIFMIIFVTLVRFWGRIATMLFSRSPERGVRKNHNIMVIGAGQAGSMIIREIKSSSFLKNDKVVCVIDDDKNKFGKLIHGVKIFGDRSKITRAAEKFNVDEIIYAIPSASKKDKTEILNICKETSCTLKTLPGMYQIISGEVELKNIRKVEIEDLLGRDPISVDLEHITNYIKDKVVLVTGGGGSIGSELCRQIACYSPKQLIIFDIYENNAYEIQNTLKKEHPELNLVTLIGSVRDTKRINYVFRTYRPNIVYHAAAHKHVPLMEDSPNESIKNNVFGTLKTVQAADKYNADRFVLISTDKAVNPTNVMGASKRICEMIIQAYDSISKTEYVAVRFGNVLGSNGSVVPIFKKQIEAGGPVLVTHPDIIRYFMTIPEAVSLVLQAGAYAKGGEIFVPVSYTHL